jgi:chromate reductase
MAIRIVALAGSLRAGSFNKKLAHIAAAGAREAGADVTELDLREFPLPLFDEDLEREQGAPANVKRLKEILIPAAGLIIACPEYNSSITAALKNVIDWVSRPAPGEGRLAAFNGKVGAIMSASPGALGGLRGLVTVRSVLSSIGVLVLPDQVAVPKAHEAFDESGSLRDSAVNQAVKALGAKCTIVASKINA